MQAFSCSVANFYKVSSWQHCYYNLIFSLICTLFNEYVHVSVCIYSTRGGAKVCESPPSRLDTCIDSTKMLFQFQACPDVPGSERTGKQQCYLLTCQADNLKYFFFFGGFFNIFPVNPFPTKRNDCAFFKPCGIFRIFVLLRFYVK